MSSLHHYTNEELVKLKRKYDMEVSKDVIEEIKHTIDLDKEIERLHSIIKEVRKYIENAIKTGNCTEDITYENGIKKEHNYYVNSKELLEILDKVEEK